MSLLHAPRIPSEFACLPAADGAFRWRADNSEAYRLLCSRLADGDVVINAAGVARPSSRSLEALRPANTILPLVLALASHAAGAALFVQISSAAVQGRTEPLDERAMWRPFSVYSRSKADAERSLLAGMSMPGLDILVYRPTSVQGVDRPMTRSLARLTRLPVVPVVRGPGRALPLALVENVAAGIAFAAIRGISGIVLHPWEGITSRSVFELGRARPRLLPIPSSVASLVRPATMLGTSFSWSGSAAVRRVELLVYGQGQLATRLVAAGFVLPHGWDKWQLTMDQVRLLQT